MAGKQHHALEVHQAVVDGGDGFQIQMVGGLIQHQHVRAVEHHAGEHTPDLLAAGEDLHRLEPVSYTHLNSAINTASTVKLPMLFARIAVILLFALLAAFPAARYASHVSPTVAMSGQTVKIKRRIKRNRNIRNFEAYYARLNLKRGRDVYKRQALDLCD